MGHRWGVLLKGQRVRSDSLFPLRRRETTAWRWTDHGENVTITRIQCPAGYPLRPLLPVHAFFRIGMGDGTLAPFQGQVKK
ncbi:MAG: hypothetical protein CBC48_19820 [bacterium TMED88]|nr:MAG: hypothetical protein CBC48_19820 [bacterium TMED88]